LCKIDYSPLTFNIHKTGLMVYGGFMIMVEH